ncbi:MAG: DNA alkylation repair protein [Candidatus Paceibacterota bacterium]|jgi:3-methyladenine DNA glycosylase AlkD
MKDTRRQRAKDVIAALKANADPRKAGFLSGFFKTGKGEYAEGDVFLGLTVPESRLIAKEFGELNFEEIEKLLASSFHEARLIALLILVSQFKKGDQKKQKDIFNFYLAHTEDINNWDLVDTSAPQIVGGYLLKKDRKILYKLAKSKNIWERRIAIVSTYSFIRNGGFDDTLALSLVLMKDKHDLIHKAVGWMLREVGKKNEKVLSAFLDTHCLALPRTALRYSIERFPEKIRLSYLKRI